MLTSESIFKCDLLKYFVWSKSVLPSVPTSALLLLSKYSVFQTLMLVLLPVDGVCSFPWTPTCLSGEPGCFLGIKELLTSIRVSRSPIILSTLVLSRLPWSKNRNCIPPPTPHPHPNSSPPSMPSPPTPSFLSPTPSSPSPLSLPWAPQVRSLGRTSQRQVPL